MLELSVQAFVWVSHMVICRRLHWRSGEVRFYTYASILAKVKYYLKVAKSSNSVIHNVF